MPGAISHVPIEPWWETNPATTPRQELGMVSPELGCPRNSEKQSGTTWSLEGGQWIVDLRVIQLSGIWTQVYQAYLQAKILSEMGTRQGSRKKEQRKAA